MGQCEQGPRWPSARPPTIRPPSFSTPAYTVYPTVWRVSCIWVAFNWRGLIMAA